MSGEKNDGIAPEYTERRDDTSLPASEKMSVGRYLATRLSTLKPPMDRVENPIKLLGMLTTRQWMYWLVAFIAWTWVCLH